MSEIVVRRLPGIVGADVFVDEPEPRRRLSIPRVVLAVVLVAGVLFAAQLGVRRAIASTAQPPNPTWFAPYVDATLTPTLNFQNLSSNPARQLMLGFVVANPKSSCTPSWGGYYSLDGADAALNLSSRIAQYRSLGGAVAISFGGQDNTELAVSCTSTDALEAAYASVVKHYGISTLDFDIEGTAVDNEASITRRAVALALLSHRLGSRHLQIWLTLPVSPTGLEPDALAVVSATLAAHVPIAGVNDLAMDFGVAESNMEATVEHAVSTSAGQLAAVERQHGVALSGTGTWNHLGATVMIGQNDSSGEQFTTTDATELVAFAEKHHLGRVSMWSINRDASCGAGFAEVGVLSNTCSGVAQSDLEFTQTLAKLPGTLATKSAFVGSTPVVDTNPANDPYPQWQPAFDYETGYKVVREGEVYQAKWYNEGEDPAASVAYSWQTPWLLIGPVLPTDHAPTITTLPAGTDPAWSSTATYETGAKVLFDGLPYQAAWYNVGSSPAASLADPSGSPWKALYTLPGEPTS